MLLTLQVLSLASEVVCAMGADACVLWEMIWLRGQDLNL